jgi:eukaryotic-like serine/threonine-protein kinase
MAINDALCIAEQVASALAAAHTAGIIHRDIKPDNIILRHDSIVKVLDFGLAKLAEESPSGTEDPTRALVRTSTGVVMGTVTYMSPEQARGLSVDARTDIWSLGIVLYEMIAGRIPFDGPTSSDVSVSILEREPPVLTTIAPDASQELQRIVTKALRKNREERYQGIKDLLVALKALRQESELTAETATKLPRQTSGFQSAPTAWRPWHRIRKLLSTAAVLIGLLVIALVGWYFIRPHANATPPPLIAIPLTTDPGFEGMPSLSPDGNFVAFIAGGGEQQKDFDLYVKQIGSGPPLRLTCGPAVEEFPAWSPDGRSIAFVRPTGQKLEVFLISPLGGPERKMAETTPYRSSGELDWNANYLSWSPDSKYLVMADQASATEPFSLFVFSVATGEKRRLTTPPSAASTDGDPAISPDGHVLAFVRVISDGNPQLYLLPLSEDYGPAGEARRLDLPQTFVTGPAWTSDGREIIYSGSEPWEAGERKLWRVPVSGSDKPQPVASVGENGSHATISRHGNRLVYAVWTYDDDIWRVELVGPARNSPAVKLIASTRFEESPRYSFDGSRIAFTSDRSGHSEIWVCNSNGSSQVQLTSLAGAAGSPRWFPDSHRLVFDLLKGSEAHTYSIDADSRVPSRLTNDLSEDVTPRVSHDGKWIYFGSKRTGRMEIWRLRVEGGEAVQVTHNGGVEPIESADGKLIYYAKAVGETEVWKVPVSGGDETRVFGPVWFSWFAVVADGIYFIDSRGQAYAASSRENSLKFYRFATAATEKIADIRLNPGDGLSVSPDGRYALMPLGDPEVCDLNLVENFR